MDAMAPYSIAKSGTTMVNAKYGLEPKLKEEGFTFLAINPGFVNTGETTKTEFTQAELKMFGALTERAIKAYPEFKGALTPETSVKMMLDIIERATLADSGRFIGHKGNEEWL